MGGSVLKVIRQTELWCGVVGAKVGLRGDGYASIITITSTSKFDAWSCYVWSYTEQFATMLYMCSVIRKIVILCDIIISKKIPCLGVSCKVECPSSLNPFSL